MFKSNYNKVEKKNPNEQESIDSTMGFTLMKDEESDIGYLLNMRQTSINDRLAMDFYFIKENGETFKAKIEYLDYFYIQTRKNKEAAVEEWIRRKFENVKNLSRVVFHDLDLPNHLLGNNSTYIKLEFNNSDHFAEVKRALFAIVKKNKADKEKIDVYELDIDEKGYKEAFEYIIDMREYDVPYVSRIAIDNNFRAGLWYDVKSMAGTISITRNSERVLPAEPVVLAFDIETTKAPLKFPEANIDQIMMISYMVDGQGYLITNREIVSADIEDFDYSPKPGEYDGPFCIFNESNEKSLLERFFEHVRELKPAVFVTYNGDFFDWPFVEARSKVYDLDMFKEIGFTKNDQGEYNSACSVHMDCFKWVQRDSYLPVGSQGLKAVTKYKLGYDPKELDPELMTPYASENPEILADYSVSDAVSTYYLYMKYVHPFIFSLCNIIPLPPDDVLRKGSGTLCEMLLMVEAFKAQVIMPNKHVEERGKFFEGHLLESETYVGGHVEALESGVFRSDLATNFRLKSSAFVQLIADVERALKFSIEIEEKMELSMITNFDEVRDEIIAKLAEMRDTPNRRETPLIYHLDVAAMYPNIILTNRLQPPSIVNEETCASCDFNKPGAGCQKPMEWSWRGEYFPADRSEYNMIKNQLESETFPVRKSQNTSKSTSTSVNGASKKKFNNNDNIVETRKWNQLSEAEQSSYLNKRISDYCRKVYRKMHEQKVKTKHSIVCQRENSFYVDTVRSFRDLRYEYKGELKKWKKKLDIAIKEGELLGIDEAKKMIVRMDSLQLAHKCILNSFYGYVMRKGSRWYSMEMAGIVCLTGANIIRMARELVEQIGRPLELDTDGIWCILPSSFPENFTFNCSNGKTITISYPCVMLNHLVHDKFTNHQYQTLSDPINHIYTTHSENSIFFEVDGPYRAMILPASKEENKLLKKRYAVFNEDGSLAELKGFEVKRRGELKIIKIFQEEVFKVFLQGKTLEECYTAVGEVADRWLDILFTKGKTATDDELLEYISENKSMSKSLEEYGAQKSTSISTAKRLAEFLGDQMVKDKGLACKFIISAKPIGAPVATRAIPIAIFSADEAVKKHFLRKWLHDNSLVSYDIRDILDWSYYLERLGSTIQKLVTIPAAMQKISNPVPRVPHPDWLLKRSHSKLDDMRQHRIGDMFRKMNESNQQKKLHEDSAEEMEINEPDVADMEDQFSNANENQVIKRFSGPVTQKKGKGTKVVEDLSLPEVKPSMFTDYSGFLKYQKIKWKLMRKQRKIDHNNLSKETGPVTLKPGQSLSSFYQRQARSLLHRHWEVIQIAETDIPGEFRMWILVDRNMMAIHLNVPRIFYVNCREPDERGIFSRASKILPRSHVAYHLYKFQLKETEFEEQGDLYKTFAWGNNGLYEQNVPLAFRALLHLGAVAALDFNNKLSNCSTDSKFDLFDFQTHRLPTDNYLSGNRLNYIFLFHSNTDNRHVFGVFMIASSKVRIVIVDPHGNEHMPNLNRLYETMFADYKVHDGVQPFFQYSETMDFNVSYVTTEDEAYRAIQKTFADYQDERMGPTAILVQTPRLLSQFVSHVRIMKEFPLITGISLQRDNRYPAIDWQRQATRRMFRHYFYAEGWLRERASLCRYGNIPIGNLEPDITIFFSDLFAARTLTERDMVLWYSSTERPDLGGREEDDNLYALDELVDPEFSYPGCYSTICIEYEINNLPINTINQSSFINEIEGSDGYAGLTNADMLTLDKHLKLMESKNNSVHEEPSDPNAPSYQAFKCLKDLVKVWNKEHVLRADPVAQLMLKNFYRWISSPSSKMYDPSLYAYIHGLMKKVLMQLLAEFRRLGSKVVFANFNRLIIVTTKTSLENTIAYNDFIVKTIKSKDVFFWLELKPVKYWDHLFWMDPLNYGGIAAEDEGTRIRKKETADECTSDEDSENEGSDSNIPLVMHWNINNYLPPYIQEFFEVIVGEFIIKMHEIKHRAKSTTKPGQTPVRPHIPLSQMNADSTAAISGNALLSQERQLIREYFTRKLLEIIRDIQKTLSGVIEPEDRDAISFPRLPGSHLNMTNPNLELIKCIVQVFNLVPHLEDDVRVMRKNLLTLIGIREFSPEATFVNPGQPFVISRVICSFCLLCRDIDLAHDESILSGEQDANGDLKRWACTNCFHEYDKGVLEELLVVLVQKWIMAYQIQDLQCSTCKTTKVENLRSTCKVCANGYELMPSVVKEGKDHNGYLKKLQTLNEIASMYKMNLLKEVSNWALTYC